MVDTITVKEVEGNKDSFLVISSRKRKVFEITKSGAVFWLRGEKFTRAKTDKELNLALGEAFQTLVDLNIEKESKIQKAFGGCTKCYGKGYSTQGHGGKTEIHICICSRGAQINDILQDAKDSADLELIEFMKRILPEYIEAAYPKGKSKERGAATVHIVEFIQHLKKAL